MNQYQRHGVKENLLIYPNEKIVEQYILDENCIYVSPYIYNEDDVFHSKIFPEFEITMSALYS
jgi:Uma2 family endonuclease